MKKIELYSILALMDEIKKLDALILLHNNVAQDDFMIVKGNIQLFHSQKIDTYEKVNFSHIIYESKGKRYPSSMDKEEKSKRIVPQNQSKVT